MVMLQVGSQGFIILNKEEVFLTCQRMLERSLARGYTKRELELSTIATLI